MTQMRKPVTKCKECGGTAFTWHCYQTSQHSGIEDGRLRMHDIRTVFVLACDECSEDLRTVKGDEVAQWMTATKANL